MPRPQLFVVYAAGGSVGTGVLCAPCPGLASSSHTHTHTHTHTYTIACKPVCTFAHYFYFCLSLVLSATCSNKA